MTEKISYADYALIDLLDAFASNEPLPGGGSASAVAGALGVSLLLMVAGLPKTRSGPDVPEEATDLAEASARLRPLRDKLLELVDRDTAAYRALIAAMRMPKDSDEQRGARTVAVQAATQGATEIPLETMRECQQALAGSVVVARNAHRAAASDAAVAVELLLAAVRGSAANVDTNLKGVTDQHYCDRIRMERDQLAADSAADAARAQQLLNA
jgi:formiminotetrahydrofolate cyclodeaminase